MTSQALEPISGDVIQYPTAPTTLFQSTEPADIVKRATAVAKALAPVISDQKLYKTISGRSHVLVEGWTLLGSMLGVFPVTAWCRPLENGWEARVEARTLGGQLVGAAEAQCTRSENTWKNRDDFALRSMAQTRATSKAMRLPLGFVVTLAGYDATPAEEMDGVAAVIDAREQARSRAAQRQQSPSQRPAPEPVDAQSELISPDDLPFETEPPKDTPVDVATLRRLLVAGEAVQMDKAAITEFVRAQHPALNSPKQLTQQQAEAIIARWEAAAE